LPHAKVAAVPAVDLEAYEIMAMIVYRDLDGTRWQGDS
jgi:hypothetical protein